MCFKSAPKAAQQHPKCRGCHGEPCPPSRQVCSRVFCKLSNVLEICKTSLSTAGLSTHVLSKVCQRLCPAEAAHDTEEKPSQEKEGFHNSLKASSGCRCRIVQARTQLRTTQAEVSDELNLFSTHSLNWIITINYTVLNSGHALSGT